MPVQPAQGMLLALSWRLPALLEKHPLTPDLFELTAKLGGYAVGVATNEKTGDGIDEKKRARLMSAGADMIIPHFEDTEAILKALHI